MAIDSTSDLLIFFESTQCRIDFILNGRKSTLVFEFADNLTRKVGSQLDYL